LSKYCQYIEQNPVRTGLVKKASDWPYFWEAQPCVPMCNKGTDASARRPYRAHLTDNRPSIV
jgi:hypothetical protein